MNFFVYNFLSAWRASRNSEIVYRREHIESIFKGIRGELAEARVEAGTLNTKLEIQEALVASLRFALRESRAENEGLRIEAHNALAFAAVAEKEAKKLHGQNLDLYRAFRHKMSRKAKCEYRSELQKKNEQLERDVKAVIDDNIRIRSHDFCDKCRANLKSLL